MDDDERRRELIRQALTPIDHPQAASTIPGRGEVFVCPACHRQSFRISYGRVRSLPGEHTSVVIARIRRQYRDAVVASMREHFTTEHPHIDNSDAYIRGAYNWDVL